jgi:hypothetical protein
MVSKNIMKREAEGHKLKGYLLSQSLCLPSPLGRETEGYNPNGYLLSLSLFAFLSHCGREAES